MGIRYWTDRDNFSLRIADILKETKIRLRRTMLARKLKISIPAVSKSVIRGEKLAKAGKYALIE
jgi:Mn-dependent DtxR family transcriptional regulator